MLTLDTDLDDVLDYRDLAQGMGLWKAEKWETKRKQIAHAAAADDQGQGHVTGACWDITHINFWSSTITEHQ